MDERVYLLRLPARWVALAPRIVDALAVRESSTVAELAGDVDAAPSVVGRVLAELERVGCAAVDRDGVAVCWLADE